MFERLVNFFSRSGKTQSLTSDDKKDLIEIVSGIQEKKISLVSAQMASFSTGIPKCVNEENLLAQYHELAWVHTAVAAIIEPGKDIPIKIYRVKEKSKPKAERKEVLNGMAYDLLQRPNLDMSFSEWQEYLLGSILLDGNFYSWIDSETRSMWPLRPPYVFVKASRSNFIESYVYRNEDWSEFDYIDPVDMIHGKNYSPKKNGMFYGLSPLEAAWDAVNYLENEAKFNKLFWKEGGRLQGAFITKDSLDAVQEEQLAKSLQKKTKGIKNMGKDFILSGGMDYKQLGVSAKDQNILERLGMATEEILAVYRVPPGIVGLLEFSNYSNMEVQKRLLWENAIVPALARVTQALNKNPLTSENGALYFEHDLSEISVLQEDMEKKAKIGQILISSRQKTPNEVREEFWEAPPLPGGDELESSQPAQPSLLQFSKTQEESKKKELTAIVHNPAWVLSKESASEVAKQFDDELQSFDDQFIKICQAHFKDQNTQIQKNLQALVRSSGGEPKIEDFPKMMSGLEDEAQRFKDDLKDPMSKVIVKFGNDTFNKLESKTKSVKSEQQRRRQNELLQDGFDFTDPAIQKYLLERPIAVAGIVDQDTVEEMRVAIADKIRQGASYSEIANTVSEYFNSIESYRSMRIARTEAASAANYAIVKTFSQNSDVVWGKRWITARDDLVRTSHQEDNIEPNVSGEPITGLNDEFILGSKVPCQRPTASGVASEDINCRCTIAAVTMYDALERGLITQAEYNETFE